MRRKWSARPLMGWWSNNGARSSYVAVYRTFPSSVYLQGNADGKCMLLMERLAATQMAVAPVLLWYAQFVLFGHELHDECAMQEVPHADEKQGSYTADSRQ